MEHHTRRCRCQTVKSYSEFLRDKNNRGGVGNSAVCKRCNSLRNTERQQNQPDKRRQQSRNWAKRHPENGRKASRAWKQRDPEGYKALQRKWSLAEYGLTTQDYDRMLAAQQGSCAICREPPTGKRANQVLHVDHDHITGKVRALLCVSCNHGLGKMKDSPALLPRAAAYLEEHGQPANDNRLEATEPEPCPAHQEGRRCTN